MWPGGEALRTIQPTYHVRHKSATPVQAKMDTLLEWLDKPTEERPTVMTVYISEVDTAGHYFGPDSKRREYYFFYPARMPRRGRRKQVMCLWTYKEKWRLFFFFF